MVGCGAAVVAQPVADLSIDGLDGVGGALGGGGAGPPVRAGQVGEQLALLGQAFQAPPGAA